MANIPFSLNVPTDATPGDHAGGIVALNEAIRAGDEGGDADSNVNVACRDGVGARIYLRVKGPVEAGLAVSSVSLSTSSSTGFRFGVPAAGSVSYRIVNIGNVRVSPMATVKVEGLFGLGEQTLEPRALPELLPGAAVEITESIESLPPVGLLTASVDVTGTTQGDGYVTASGDDVALADAVVPPSGRRPRPRRRDHPTALVPSPPRSARLRQWRRRPRVADRHAGRIVVTRALSVPVRLITVLALAVLLPSLGASLAGAQPSAPASSTRSTGLLSPGQTVSVTGAGWAPGEFVSVQVCGNDGVNGSSDCDVASGASFPILTGELRTPIVVTIPPRPCPCVILAVGALTQAKTPISIAGTTSAPVSSDSPLVNPDIGPTLRVDRAVVEDDAEWPSWFGAPAERTLVLTVTNTGAAAVPQPFMSVAYGKATTPGR